MCTRYALCILLCKSQEIPPFLHKGLWLGWFCYLPIKSTYIDIFPYSIIVTGIIVDKYGVKIVPQTIDKKYILNRLFSMNQNIYKRNTDFNLN